MQNDTRVLVVGTTPDYIDWINQQWPTQALCLTDEQIRLHAVEPKPDLLSEVLTDLSSFSRATRDLSSHLDRFHQHLEGITCFDCESMPLAAYLARSLSLPYPSEKAVHLCRNKYDGKHAWQNAGVPCPKMTLVNSLPEAVAFFCETKSACVLKPLSGAGSEYVYFCTDRDQVIQAVGEIQQGLRRQANNPLYRNTLQGILMETHVAGPEYSCDFILEANEITIIRLAQKIQRPEGPFGTVQAYMVPAHLPEGVSHSHLKSLLARAAQALDVTGIICMVDFIVGTQGPVLLEMTPRPGGDCLPALIRYASGTDMLGLALDVARGFPIECPPLTQWKTSVGLRLHAPHSGVLAHIGLSRVQGDHRIRTIHISHKPGHQVVLPPLDYSSWIMGHLIFCPDPDQTIASQCSELVKKVDITITGEI
ncbi:MAG: ATP-grasp domain-containing protein [Phycisphaeraceae bacterium]|nr:ATP-grasp domain-containing protein [Phycisphaeraceae bacterium]